MRRIKMVIALVLALAMMLTASVAPAMANNNDNNNDQLDRRDVNLDRALLHELRTDDNNDCFFGCGFDRFNDGFDFVDNSCPFWDDHSGIINWTDCLD